ncbi:MAG: dephospho-CoA kinase [Hyphomicrobium sp.]|uniref:dephospho-CoA kinase n=1 Tax=Hyphomicrobium sp. TaxID=82 RepID=UPI0039E5DCF1
MLIVGLTGSIGMGKSTAAARFRARGIGVFDADAEVHRLYAGPLAEEIERAFPGSLTEGAVDRGKLAEHVIRSPHRFKELEAIVHPRVHAAERAFLQAEQANGASLAVLEIPLFLEGGRDEHVDAIVVVTASPEIQRERVLSRAGMTEEKFKAIVARQITEAEKKVRADFVVDTSGSIESCNSQIDVIIAKLPALSATAYEEFWRD